MSRPISADFSRALAAAAIAALAPSPAFAEDGYWTRYEQCLVAAHAGNEAACRSYVDAREARFGRLATDIAQLTGGISCVQGNDLFLGNGIVVDQATCGPRTAPAGCPGLDPGDLTCPASIPSGGTPVVAWCESCRPPGDSSVQPPGCLTCGSRPDVSQDAALGVERGVRRLLECFAPTGPFPNSSLRTAVVQTYTELGATRGITIRCPDDPADVSQDHLTAGDANHAESRINVYNRGIGNQGVFGHEFLHMTSHLGATRRVDDHNGHTHNDPHGTHEHADDGTVSATENPLGLPNDRFDRIYSCERICFPGSELVSKEECERCMGYGGSSGRSTRIRPCRNLLTLAEIDSLNELQTDADARLTLHCGRMGSGMAAYERTAAGADVQSDNPFLRMSTAGANRVHVEIHLEPESDDYSTARAECRDASQDMVNRLSRLLGRAGAGSPSYASDTLNRSALESLYRKYRFTSLIDRMRERCRRIELYRTARIRCEARWPREIIPGGDLRCSGIFADGSQIYNDRAATIVASLSAETQEYNAEVAEASARLGHEYLPRLNVPEDTDPDDGPPRLSLLTARSVCRAIPQEPPIEITGSVGGR